MKSLLRELAYASVIVAAMSATVHYMTRPAEAQSANSSVAAVIETGTSGNVHFAYLANGDVYQITRSPAFESHMVGNVFAAGNPTPVQQKTWSEVKANGGH